MGRQTLAILAIMAVLATLPGCVAMKATPRPAATVLMSVVLRGEIPAERQPVGLLVSIDGRADYEGQQFAFAPNTQIPGHYTNFLVTLALPVGPHHLTRLTGVRADGTTVADFDVDIDKPFEVRARATDYLGHLELSRAGTSVSLVLADAYDDDIPNFVNAYSSLRGHSVSRRAPLKLIAIEARAREPLAAHVAIRTSGSVSGLDASAANSLPSPARAAFQVFLHKGYPRAFAVSATGYTGIATGGADVIERALRTCKRAAGAHDQKSRCTLFALDDTLLASVGPQ